MASCSTVGCNNDSRYVGAWNDDMASHPTMCLNCVDRNVICVKRKLPSRRHGCPCFIYYANSDVTFHLEFIGDLAFKLNPGPLSRSIPTIVSRHESFRNNKGIWRCNPRNLISVQPNRLQSLFSKLFVIVFTECQIC